MKIHLILALLFIVALAESKKGKQVKGKQEKGKVKMRTVGKLDSSQFPGGAKIGFTCRITQIPMFRSQKRPKIVFESLTIIKYTRISINGQIAFDLICKRDTSTDQGPVVPPQQAEAAASAASGGGGGDGGDAAAAAGGGGDDGGGDAGGGDSTTAAAAAGGDEGSTEAGGGEGGGGDGGGGGGEPVEARNKKGKGGKNKNGRRKRSLREKWSPNE